MKVLIAYPGALSIPGDQTHHEKTGYWVLPAAFDRVVSNHLPCIREHQPTGNLDLYSSANIYIYRKKSSFSVLSRIFSVKSYMDFFKTRQQTLVTNGIVNI